MTHPAEILTVDLSDPGKSRFVLCIAAFLRLAASPIVLAGNHDLTSKWRVERRCGAPLLSEDGDGAIRPTAGVSQRRAVCALWR